VAAGSEALARAGELDSAGHERDALEAYREAFALGLDDQELLGALLGFGSTLRNMGELEESERVLREAVAKFPDHGALRVFLALTRWEAGAAADSFRELVEALFRADAPGMRRYERAIRGYTGDLR
jgi:tetratricopeptide (TPR) repeat protein